MKFIIPAGGDGDRLFGKDYPKALVWLFDKPIMELLIDKILTNFQDAEIYVVTVNKWKNDFDRWVDGKFKDGLCKNYSNAKVEVIYEENFDSAVFSSGKGTAFAIYRALDMLGRDEKIRQGENFYVFNADNYFNDNLKNFFTKSEEWLGVEDCLCVNAAYQLQSSADARLFGVIHHRENDNNITELVEKSPNLLPSDTLVSTGCYAFKADFTNDSLFKKFLVGSQHRNEKIDLSYLISFLINRGKFAKYMELKGVWFDVGNRHHLAQATKHFISTYIDPIDTIGELIHRTHHESNDQVFVCVERSDQVQVDTHTITLNFASTDSVFSKKPEVIQHEWIRLFSKLIAAQESNRGTQLKELNELSAELSKNGSLNKESDPNTQKILFSISGGVLLIDTQNVEDNRFERNQSRIPLQRRDTGATQDPDRLTMPAGGLDTLNLTECCYAELQEEFVFYGGQPTRTLFYLVNRDLDFNPVNEEDFLTRIIEKPIPIPGIDSVDMLSAKSDSSVRPPLRPINVNEYRLERRCKGLPNVWKIVIKVDGDEKDSGWFFVTLDESINTLECRKISWADISEVGLNTIGRQPRQMFGKLAGLADGEGFGRQPFLFGMDGIIKYIEQLDGMKKEEFLQYIFSTRNDLLKVLCSGESGTGRFRRFNFSMPIVTTTCAVGKMLKFLPNISR